MSLKKRLTAVLVLICTLVWVIYTGTKGFSVQEEGQVSFFGNKETIYFWYTDEALTDFMNSAAVTFGEENDVRVIPVLKSGMEYLEAVNHASLNDDEALPDVYLLSNDSLGKAYLAGLASPIENDSICNISNFPQSALSAVSYDGKIVAYPYYFETSAYLYNKTYLVDFIRAQIQTGIDTEMGEAAQKELESGDTPAEAEEIQVDEVKEVTTDTEEQADSIMQEEIDRRLEELLPETTEELLTFADSYDAPETVESILKWDVSDVFYNYYFIGQYMIVGGEAGDNADEIDIYNTESIQCLKEYQKLNQFFYIDPDTVTYDSVLQEFIDGKVVFAVVTNDAVAKLAEAKEEGSFNFEYGIMPVPRISEKLEGRSLSVTNTVVVNGYSAKKELANEFAAFLTTEYVDNLYSRTGKTASTVNVNLEDEHLEGFKSEYATSIPVPKMIETSNFWIELEILFAKVWNGEDINDLVRGLSEKMMTQVLGEPYTEEYIEVPDEAVEEEGEFVDDGEGITANDIVAQ